MSAKVKIGIAIAVPAAAAVLVFVWLNSARGFSARGEPTALEAFVARRLHSFGIPRDAKQARNPVTVSDEVVSEAMAHFADHCAICHGNDGSGDTPIGRGLYPKPPDMRQPATQNRTDGELFYIIHNGIRLSGMPAFGEDDGGPDLDSWKLVHFIRRLPQLAAEEVERMKSMNPKSPDEWREEEAIRKFLEGDDSAAPPAPHQHH